MVLEDGGGQGFCDDSTRALVMKSVTMGEKGLNIFQNCVTSFMDDVTPNDAMKDGSGYRCPLLFTVLLFAFLTIHN